MNLAQGKLLGAGQSLAIELGGQRMPLPDRPVLRDIAGREVVIGLRPSAFSLDDTAVPGTRLKVRAITVESLGDEKNVLFQPPFALAETAELTPMWTAKVEPAAPVRPGDEIELAVDLEQAYFFDPATGLGLWSPADRALRT